MKVTRGGLKCLRRSIGPDLHLGKVLTLLSGQPLKRVRRSARRGPNGSLEMIVFSVFRMIDG